MKRLTALLLICTLLLPLAIGGITLSVNAAGVAPGEYIITGGGVLGAPDYALNTTTYTGAELGTILAATEAADSGVSFNANGTAVSGTENFVAELVSVSGDIFAIRLNNNRYLGAAGSTNLVSYVAYEANTEAQWRVDLTDNVWTISNVKYPARYLAYSETAHYFRTFTSGGVKPTLYSFSPEVGGSQHSFSMRQSAACYGSGSITATYNGAQYVYPEDATNVLTPTSFTVSDGARVTLYFEPSEGSALAKVRVNGLEQTLSPSGNGYSLILNGITSATNVTAVWVSGELENQGELASAVVAEYDNPTYDIEGIGCSDPITTVTVNTAEIMEGSVFTDKSVHYNENALTFTNALSLNSVAYQTATSESVVIPMDVAIILDLSASMNTAISGTSNYRMTEVAAEVNTLIENIIDASEDNRVGMVTFSGGTSTGTSASNGEIVVPLAKYDSITLSYTNGSTSSLRISADNRTPVTKTVTGGTYTQGGLGRAYQMFAGLSESDRTVVLNGQQYERTPVIILVTDGNPTWATSDYTNPVPGNSTYGNGAEQANAGMGNCGYYTLLSAQYLREQVMAMYDNNSRSRFYTIGVDTSRGDYPAFASAVLNPTSATIGALPNGEPYNTMRTGLNSSTYRNLYYQNGQYVSYADASYDVLSGSQGLQDAFREILTEAQAVITNVMPVVENTSVDFYDALGEDMELKSDPVLLYNGTSYTPTAVSEPGGKTSYHYTGIVQAYDDGPTVDLATMEVTKEQDENGIWIVRWKIPAALVPSYIYNPDLDEYIPSETAILSYDVAPTNSALSAVTSTRTFFSNYFDEEGYHANASYRLNSNSPFYQTYYGSLNPTVTLDKLSNTSETDSYIGITTHDNGLLTKQLGNNGRLTVSAKRADVTVKKLWKNADGSLCEAPSGAFVVGQLWRRVDGVTDMLVGEQMLNAANNWQYTWSNLILRDDEHTYSYYGKETVVSGAEFYDYSFIEESDENGELRISNYYNRMTITVNTDWYYNGVLETDDYVNRTINTLYYRDATNTLVPVSGVDSIVFDSTSGLTEDWNDQWTDLLIRNPDGTPIEYVVEQQIVNEDVRGTHTTFYTVDLDPSTEGASPRDPSCDPITGIINTDPVVQIDNYLENPPIAVTVNKVWADNSGDEQDDITVSLYRTPTLEGVGTLIKTATFGKNDNWTYTFTDLAPGYYYYVREVKVSDYSAAYTETVCQATHGNTPSITVTNTRYPTTGFSIEKLWQTDSHTPLLDASNMPAVNANLYQKCHCVTTVPEYTVTFRFLGRTSGSSTDRTVATQRTISGVKAGATATLQFNTFNNLRLSSNNDNVTTTLTSGSGTLNSTGFNRNVSSSGSYWSRSYYMAYSGSISVSDVRSSIVVTVLCNNIYQSSSTFGSNSQSANLTAAGGDMDSVTDTEALYETVTLSSENDWVYHFDELPTTEEEGNSTKTYSYYVQEENTVFEPTYTNNNIENGISAGVVTITNTIYPEILPDMYVYDFGLPMDADVLDNDRKSLNINGVQLTGVSMTAPNGVTVNTGVSTGKLFATRAVGSFGVFTVLDNKVRFTPSTTNVNGTDRCYYEIFVPGVGYMYSYVELAPATNVFFEESFLANNGFEVVGAGAARTQSSQNLLYGFDAAYRAYEENSLDRGFGATVSQPLVQPTATFTFTGTGFDIISRCTPDSGVMVVEARTNNENGVIARRFLVDTYLLEDSLYQLPVVHCTDLDYGTYYVTVKAYYNAIFDHYLPKTRRATGFASVLEDLGWEMDAEYTYIPANSAEPSSAPKRMSPTAAAGSYNVYLDGVRIFNPLGTSPSGVGGTLYNAAKETNPTYVQIRSRLLDASSWDSVGNDTVDAVMYIADKTTAIHTDSVLSTGIYLSTSGLLCTQEEDGRIYLLNQDGGRVQYEEQDVWTEVTEENGESVRKYYYGDTLLTKQEINVLDLCYYDNIYRANGPENEAYLTNGHGIAFAVEHNGGVHISAKSPNGEPVTLCVYNGAQWVEVATITSATEMFYDVSSYAANCDNNLIIKCVCESENGILSLCQVKLLPAAVSAKSSIRLDNSIAYAALSAMSAEVETIAEHTHSFVLTSDTATCTERGTQTYTCSSCDETVTKHALAKGHSYTMQLVAANACISDGSMIYTCSDCDARLTREIPRHRHSYTEETTQVSDGTRTDYTCVGCGFSYHSMQYVDLPADEQGLQCRISSAWLRLCEDIRVIYAADIPAGYENPYMVFTFMGTDYTVTDYTVDAQGKYCFEFSEMLPQYMGENICATLHATKDGTDATDTVAQYSVKTYCENQLRNHANDSALVTLLSDILTYGAAAQSYTDYRTDTLVTDGMTLSSGTYPALTGRNASLFGTADASVDWKSASLMLTSNLAVRFTFYAASVEDLSVQVCLNGRTQEFEAEDFIAGEKANTWCLYFRNINATEFDDAITASFFRNGTQTGRTLQYAISAYICNMQDNTDVPYLAQLLCALYNYGESAKAYAKATDIA